MLGFFCCFKDNSDRVVAKDIRFVHIPDGLSDDDIKIRFSKEARDYAMKVDKKEVYLNFGKDNSIKYVYEN